MDSIINKLTEIEDAAKAIVQHAEEQKEVLNKEYEQKRKAFDKELETQTQTRLKEIQSQLEKETSYILDSQSGSSEEAIQALQKEYEENHTKYAQKILSRITEV